MSGALKQLTSRIFVPQSFTVLIMFMGHVVWIVGFGILNLLLLMWNIIYVIGTSVVLAFNAGFGFVWSIVKLSIWILEWIFWPISIMFKILGNYVSRFQKWSP